MITTYPLDVLDHAEPRVYGYMGRTGELPLKTGHAVAIHHRDTGAKIYDSAVELAELGVFATDAEAADHAQAWIDAQIARHERVDGLKGDRRDRLLSRWDQIDEEEARINASIKTLKSRKDQCDEDRAQLRKEAKSPEVLVGYKNGQFTIGDAPALSEGTCGRRWSGNTEADAPILEPAQTSKARFQ
jgi:hypothetical protein